MRSRSELLKEYLGKPIFLNLKNPDYNKFGKEITPTGVLIEVGEDFIVLQYPSGEKQGFDISSLEKWTLAGVNGRRQEQEEE